MRINTPTTKSKGNGQSAHSNLQSAGLLTPKQVAAQTAYRSEVSVLRAFRQGKLRGYKLNPRTIRFHPDDVEAWLSVARV
ncbi:MAG: helix-turn-helix domain-containing protein [Verrucomicrobiia bacterium]